MTEYVLRLKETTTK